MNECDRQLKMAEKTKELFDAPRAAGHLRREKGGQRENSGPDCPLFHPPVAALMMRE